MWHSMYSRESLSGNSSQPGTVAVVYSDLYGSLFEISCKIFEGEEGRRKIALSQVITQLITEDSGFSGSPEQSFLICGQNQPARQGLADWIDTECRIWGGR